MGIYGMYVMPKDEFPHSTIRQGVVVAVYPGATSEEVEEQVARPLERYLFTYGEVNRIKTTTTSQNGMCIVMVKLNDDVDNKDEVWSKIKHGLNNFKSQLPTGVLVPYYIDDYEKFASNNTYFTRFNSSHVQNLSDRKIIFDAIFSSKRELKLRMCAYFDLDYFGSKVDSIKHFSFTAKDSSLKDYVPNPHLDNYNCFEDNRPPILEQLNMGDPIGAIECCIACAQRVNIHESVNINSFGKAILDHEGKILVTNDGREMTVLEALEYLKGKQNAENG